MPKDPSNYPPPTQQMQANVHDIHLRVESCSAFDRQKTEPGPCRRPPEAADGSQPPDSTSSSYLVVPEDAAVAEVSAGHVVIT